MSVAKARGIQITEFSDNIINPDPIQVEETDILLEDYLSPTKLKALTGVDDLEDIKVLEMRVDTSETSLGNFGSMVPNLKHLKLNNSMIASVRDLGTSLENLQVLWMARCCLQDLDGISSMACLQELYLAYNEITDISPCSMLENLQLLDLEGNNLDDTVQVEFLALCSNLKTLTLEGNPLCIKPSPDYKKEENDTRYDYRAMVKRCIPHLEVLDEDPLSVIPSSFSSNSISLSTDWLIVNEAIKDGVGSNESLEIEDQRPGTAMRPGSASFRRPGSAGIRPRTSAGRPSSSGGQRPGTSAGERPESGGSDISAPNDVSDLTHGEVICGNPARKLRGRRKKEACETISLLVEFQHIPKLFSHYQHQPEKSYDIEEDEEMTCEEILNELKAWKEQHERKIAERRKASEPQVLKITHDDDEGDENDDEDLADYGIEISPPSSAMHNTSPTPPRSISPKAPIAPRPILPSRPKTSVGFRSRKYRHKSEDSIPVEKMRLMRASQEDDANVDEALGQSIGSSTYGSPLPVESVNNRPFSGPVIGSRKYKASPPVGVSQPKIIDNHQPVIRSSTHTPPNLAQRLASLNRPATARAALQKQVLPSRTRPFPS
ncbi:leucine-rich repeat-containing protein 56-like [Anneissia japonica]|uniref:leucine-rich repeat-containing protein 56-like n=1 Tax=Anneissia japonica TaxID=1529436 RepID=UPI0014258380|nr:leucine-rich repeat-containing protein 56-like [Anneissia japonica]